MTGSFADAVDLAGEVLNITGDVQPTTLTNVSLCAEGADGKPIKGEYTIAHAQIAKKPKIWLEPEAEVNPKAVSAIMEADMVVIAPGNLYGSLAPALVIDGIRQALKNTKAQCVYVCNLVTKPGPTDGMKVHEFADEIERLADSPFLDYVVYNKERPSDDLLAKYAHDGENPVKYDESVMKTKHYKYRAADLVADQAWSGAQDSDPIAATRSLIRHDADAVARQIMRIFFT